MAVTAKKVVALFVQYRLGEIYRMKPPTRARTLPGEHSFEDIAIDLGVTKPQVYNLISYGRGFGPEFEERFAKKHYKGDVTRLRAEAKSWWKKHGPEYEARSQAAAVDVELKSEHRSDLFLPLLDWYFNHNGLGRAVAEHREDISIDDVLRYRDEWNDDDETNSSEVYRRIRQSRMKFVNDKMKQAREKLK